MVERIIWWIFHNFSIAGRLFSLRFRLTLPAYVAAAATVAAFTALTSSTRATATEASSIAVAAASRISTSTTLDAELLLGHNCDFHNRPARCC